MVADTLSHATLEVAYATRERQRIVTVAAGVSAREAAMVSGLDRDFDELTPETLATAALGVFGERLKAPEQYLPEPGERIEIYRPLDIDPKQARRERAAKHRD